MQVLRDLVQKLVRDVWAAIQSLSINDLMEVRTDPLPSPKPAAKLQTNGALLQTDSNGAFFLTLGNKVVRRTRKRDLLRWARQKGITVTDTTLSG